MYECCVKVSASACELVLTTVRIFRTICRLPRSSAMSSADFLLGCMNTSSGALAKNKTKTPFNMGYSSNTHFVSFSRVLSGDEKAATRTNTLNRRKHTHICASISASTQTRTHKHTYTRTHILTHTYIHTHTHTHTHTRYVWCACARTFSYINYVALPNTLVWRCVRYAVLAC